MSTAEFPILLADEKELFARIADSDQEAFRLVYHHYRVRIYSFILKVVKSKYLAEEIVQDVFLKLWTKRETLVNVQSHRSYIFMMAKNAMFDHLKKIAREARLEGVLDQEIEKLGGTDDIEARLDNKENERLLEEAVNQLPAQRQKVYRLSKQEGMTYDEIAEQLNISKHTVRNQIADAVKDIKLYLQRAPGGAMALLVFLCEGWRR